MEQGNLRELEERHNKYKEDRKGVDEELRKAMLQTETWDQHVSRKKKELAEARADVKFLRNQLACVPDARNRAFGFGYGAGILRLRSLLLTNPSTNLVNLDQELFVPEENNLLQADRFRQKEMPDAFIRTPSLPPPNDAS